MPAPIEQLLSRTVYTTDGTTVNWDFSFASGYLDAAHVKAQTKTAEGAITQIVVTPGMLIGEFQLQITPALAAGLELTIYRDTPKGAPIVDFTDESGFSETALDTNAKQAVMVAAEAIDTINASDLTAAIEAAESAGAAASASAASAALAAATVATANAAAVAAQDAADDAIAAAATVNPANFATAAQGSLADTAVQPADITASSITDATAFGRSILTALTDAATRTLLGFTSFGSSVVQAVDAAAARILFGLGSLAVKNTVGSSDIDTAAVTPAKLAQPVTTRIAVTPSGVAINFTSIPAWVRSIKIEHSDLSTNGASPLRYRVGSGSVSTSGYASTSVYVGSATGGGDSTAGFDGVGDNNAAWLRTGFVELVLVDIDTNLWVLNGSYRYAAGFASFVSGSIALAGQLDRLQITTVNGTDTFDSSGRVNITYYG